MSRTYHHGALRAALLQASEAILDRDGIAALTLRATAREAGVSHAAPTHHFGDLGGLLSELAASGFIRFREAMQAGVAAAGPEPGARLLALGRAYVGFARSCPACSSSCSARSGWTGHPRRWRRRRKRRSRC